MRARLLDLVMLIAMAAALAGCNPMAGTGSLTMNITDSPVDGATEVNVKFTGIELVHSEEGNRTITFEEARNIDLLDLQGQESDSLLDGVEVAAGDYEQLRLMVEAKKGVTDSYINLDDGQHSLFVPSGAQSGLKLVSGFTVPINGSASFTIDFDLRKSIVAPRNGKGDYFLKPALRLVDNSETGHIEGSFDVTTSQCTVGDKIAVYVYEGQGVTPTDVNTTDDSSVDPVATARIEEDNGQYQYSVGYLSPDNYTIAYTCNAGSDDAESDDSITFYDVTDVNLSDSQTLTENFPQS